MTLTVAEIDLRNVVFLFLLRRVLVLAQSNIYTLNYSNVVACLVLRILDTLLGPAFYTLLGPAMFHSHGYPERSNFIQFGAMKT